MMFSENNILSNIKLPNIIFYRFNQYYGSLYKIDMIKEISLVKRNLLYPSRSTNQTIEMITIL